MSEYPHAIDLCAGCGGASYGMQSVGFNVRAAYELNGLATYTYRVHIADHDDMAVFQHDVTDVKPGQLSRLTDGINLVFGGAPCQPWSSAGAGDADDERRSALFACAEWIDVLQPEAFALENVVGLKENHPEALSRLTDALEDAGYQVGVIVLDAADYGVPQERERLFVVGCRNDRYPPASWAPPTVTDIGAGQSQLSDFQPGVTEPRTAGDALRDLPAPEGPHPPREDDVHGMLTDDRHRVAPHACGRWVERDGEEVKIPPNHIEADHNRSTRERYAEWELGYCGNSTASRRLHPDEPAPTMTVSNGTPPVHYAGRAPSKPDGAVEDVRRLTVREVAKLMTFPDHWCFAGTKHDRFRQAANAVPPLLAAHVTGHLRESVIAQTEATGQATAGHAAGD